MALGVRGLTRRDTMTTGPHGPCGCMFLAVARQQFIPDTIWRQDKSLPGPDLVPVRRDEDPDQWLRLASGDDALVTQVDDGHPAGHGGVGDLATSSASIPKVVALMLKYLDVYDGDPGAGNRDRYRLQRSVAGTSARPDHVTTIEIDPRWPPMPAQRYRATTPPSGWSTTGQAPGHGYAIAATPTARTRCTSTVDDGCGTRSKPPTAGGWSRAGPALTAGG